MLRQFCLLDANVFRTPAARLLLGQQPVCQNQQCRKACRCAFVQDYPKQFRPGTRLLIRVAGRRGRQLHHPGGTLSISQIGGFTVRRQQCQLHADGFYVPMQPAQSTGCLSGRAEQLDSKPSGAATAIPPTWSARIPISASGYGQLELYRLLDHRYRERASAPLLVTQSPGVFCAPATVNPHGIRQLQPEAKPACILPMPMPTDRWRIPPR